MTNASLATLLCVAACVLSMLIGYLLGSRRADALTRKRAVAAMLAAYNSAPIETLRQDGSMRGAILLYILAFERCLRAGGVPPSEGDKP